MLVFLSVESTFYSLKYPFLILQLAAISSSICHMTFGQFCYKQAFHFSTSVTASVEVILGKSVGEPCEQITLTD